MTSDRTSFPGDSFAISFILPVNITLCIIRSLYSNPDIQDQIISRIKATNRWNDMTQKIGATKYFMVDSWFFITNNASSRYCKKIYVLGNLLNFSTHVTIQSYFNCIQQLHRNLEIILSTFLSVISRFVRFSFVFTFQQTITDNWQMCFRHVVEVTLMPGGKTTFKLKTHIYKINSTSA